MKYESKSKGMVCAVPCAECARETEHRILESVETENYDDIVVGNSTYPYTEYVSHQVIVCAGCKTISFRRTAWDTFSANEWNQETVETLFPARLSGRKQLDGRQHLPPKLKRIYDETHTAACNQLPVLTGIGIRAIVDAVCAQKKAKGTLEQKIDKLVETSVLTPDSAKVLHRTRVLGNAAAHEVSPPTDNEMHAALTVAEHLLQTVFVIPKIAGALPKPKKKKKKN